MGAASQAIAAFAVLLLTFCSFPAAAAEDAATKVAHSDVRAKIGRSPEAHGVGRVIVYNRPIATLRATLLGIPPEDRAETVKNRIIAILERGGPGVVSTEITEQGALLKIDGRLALALTPEDVENLGDEALQIAAADATRALELVIVEYNEAHNSKRLLGAAGMAAGVTVLWIALLWVLRRIGQAILRRIPPLAQATAGKLVGDSLWHTEATLQFLRGIVRLAGWTLMLVVSYEWLGYVLRLFPYTRPWGEHLNNFFVGSGLDLLTAFAEAAPDLMIATAIFILARWFNGLQSSFFQRVQDGRVHVEWVDEDSARPTRRLVAIAIWIFALVMAYPYIPGSSSEAFKGLSVLIGLMISVGASGIVGQAASGLILMYTRTYRPGEYVSIGDNEGTVIEMGMFTTRIRTGLGEELSMPNAFVLGSVTKNFSRVVGGLGFLVQATVTIGYDAPWRQVHAMLIEAAQRTEGVARDLAPKVFQTALSDFYVEYRLVCQALPDEPLPRAELISALYANIQDVFNEHGVQIMSPHYLSDPAHPKVVRKENWYEAPAQPPG